MAYAYRGRRTNYDNIANGSICGVERTIGGSTSDLAAVCDPSLYNKDAVSPMGNVAETGGITNISAANLPGIEATAAPSLDKLTSDSEDISDGG